MVNVVVTGIGTVVGMLSKELKKIKVGQDKGANKAALYLEGEVKQSIAGRRAEPQSVDTGRFMGSVGTSKKSSGVYSVHDAVEYGKYLEFGTSRIQPRNHFRNSLNRSREKMIAIATKEIK